MSTLKKIDAASEDALHSSLDIFSVPPTNFSILKASVREILPLNSIDDPKTERFEFRVFSDSQWLDLSRTYVYLQLQLQKKNGQNWVNIDPTVDKDVATCQTLGQSFIKQLRVAVGGTEVYDSTQHYPYLCYLKNELNYSTSVKDTILAAAGYSRDLEMNNKDSPGFKTRNGNIGNGAPVEFVSRLDFDLANQNRFLVNNVDLTFTLTKMDDDFLVHTLFPDDPNTYRVRALSVRLYVVSVDVQPSLNLTIAQMLQKKSAKYPCRQMAIHTAYLTEGRTDFVHNLFTNVIPRRLIFALVSADAYDGDKTLDPFNCQPFDIREIIVNAGGLNYPSTGYNFNWDQTKGPISFVRGYLDMLNASSAQQNVTNGITMAQYKNGWTIFVVPLTASLEDSNGFEPVRYGTTTLSLKFNEKIPPKGVQLIYIVEFDSVITIDGARVVVTDNAAS